MEFIPPKSVTRISGDRPNNHFTLAHPLSPESRREMRKGSVECEWNSVLHPTDRDGSTGFLESSVFHTGRRSLYTVIDRRDLASIVACRIFGNGSLILACGRGSRFQAASNGVYLYLGVSYMYITK